MTCTIASYHDIIIFFTNLLVLNHMGLLARLHISAYLAVGSNNGVTGTVRFQSPTNCFGRNIYPLEKCSNRPLISPFLQGIRYSFRIQFVIWSSSWDASISRLLLGWTVYWELIGNWSREAQVSIFHGCTREDWDNGNVLPGIGKEMIALLLTNCEFLKICRTETHAHRRHS